MDSKEQHRQGLIRAYRQAGIDFLALRLGKIFTKIETEEDRVLHNEVLGEVLMMIEPNPVSFMRGIASIALYHKFEPRKTFLGCVASKVLEIAGMAKKG